MLQPDTDYRLIGIDRHVDPAKLVELHDPVFYPGTQITLTDGSLCAVEDLTPGQKILTHDFAEQKVSCVEIKTQRAQGKNRPLGSQSPILAQTRISSSAQNITFYIPKPMAAYGGRFIKAKDLCNGTTIDWVEPVLWIAFKYVLPLNL